MLFADDVSLEKVSGRAATIAFGGEDFDLNFEISGVYNLLNAAAAIALVRAVFDQEKLELNQSSLLETIQNIKPAFGRGETVEVNGVPIELVLVKNPGGFRLGLKSFAPENYSTMIAINDNYADGRDMSWLWDVDFSSLADYGVEQISGIRAYDMALRLFHDGVEFAEADVETDLKIAVKNFVGKNQKPKRIFCTYTAMLKIREELAKITDVEKVL
jgi:UDP-N-acetylmuramyl tripeptide synthase